MALNVLVVDDQASMVLLIGTILRKVGYHVAESATATDALDQLAQRPWSLAIVDIHLPDMSGIALMRLANSTGVALPPVIGISSSPDTDVIRQALESGMRTVLKKPLGFTQLVSSCKAALQSNRSVYTNSRGVEIVDLAVLLELRQLPGKHSAQQIVDQALVDAHRCVDELCRIDCLTDQATWRATVRTLHGVALTLGARRLISASLDVMSVPEHVLPLQYEVLLQHLTVLLDEANEWFAQNLGLLSGRERDCLRLASEGLSSKQIAEQLDIAYATVNFHLRNAALKLKASDRTESVAMAMKLGAI